MAKQGGITLAEADLEIRVSHTFAKVSDELGIADKVKMKGEPGVGRWFVRLGDRAVQLNFSADASLKKIEDEFRWAFGVLTAK